MSHPTPLNEDERPSPNALAGQLGQAIAHNAGPDVITEYRRRLACERAEKALAKALADAPPLSAAQVAHLRAIVQTYAPVES